MADLHIQILVELRKCVDQNLSLDAFRQWFVPLSLDIEQSGEPDAIELVHHLDGVLAEASSAEWSDADLREEMARIVREHAKSRGEAISPGRELVV
jgi:hypothetical protein